MSDLNMAPSLQEVRNREEQEKSTIEKTREDHYQNARAIQARLDQAYAKDIIEDLIKMFEGHRISSVNGGKLTGIPRGYNTPGARIIIKQYLGRDWSSSWLDNTGSLHDDDILCSLVIKPNWR